MTKKGKRCPHCGTHDVLPYETEEDYKTDHSFVVIVVAALILFGGYFFFVFSAYIYFPFVIFTLIIIAARMANSRDKHKKIEKSEPQDYLCMECGNSFRA